MPTWEGETGPCIPKLLRLEKWMHTQTDQYLGTAKIKTLFFFVFPEMSVFFSLHRSKTNVKISELSTD